MQPIHIIVITGLSGSGKSTAIRALEDLDFFCIDNLPVVLLPKVLELLDHTRHPKRQVGLVIDAREREFLHTAEETFQAVREAGHQLEVVFLEADTDTLVRRYSETRRKHPLAPQGSVRDGIELENTFLSDLRHLANHTINTNDLTVHDLRKEIQSRFREDEDSRSMTVNILSFGFKHGSPSEADLVFDVRFLRNPHFVPGLRNKTGSDPEVADYVLSQPHTLTFLSHLFSMLDFVLPLYQSEGKNYLTIAIGCTGGQHRSVAVAEETHRYLMRLPYNLNLRHREAVNHKKGPQNP